MKCAVWLIFACGSGVEKQLSTANVVGAATTLRHCLKVAGGLKSAGDGEAAAVQVLSCYDHYFVPMVPTLRADNPRAALSLEYGFGLLAHAMTKGRSDTSIQAGQLADRVEAVVDSLSFVAEPPQSPSPTPAPDSG